jgi:hypothetical protein
MSVSQIKNSNVVLVGIGTSTTPPASSIADLAEGQIGVFQVDGLAGTAIAADAKFVIAIGGSASKPAFVSEAIDPADVVAAKTRGLEVAVEQQDSIGFNGTSGSLATLTADNLYMVDVLVQELLTSNTDGRYIKHFQYKSGASAPTQAELASGLALSAYNNFKREAEEWIAVDVLMAAGSDVALGTGVNNVTFVKGSTSVAADDVDDATANAAFAVGDYIRVGTAATDEVYKITAIDATNNVFTIDRPFVAATQTIADTGLKRIAAASVAALNCGILMTGQALSFVVGKEQYKKVRWELVLKDFGSTASVREANADAGIGTYEQAAEAEWFAMGQLGEYHRMGEPTIHPASLNAASGVTYDITTISFRDNSVVGLSPTVSEKAITIYTPNGADYATDVTTDNGLWLQIEAALANVTGKMSHRDTGASSDTAGSLLL